MATFTDGLWKAISDADFFPSMKTVRDHCQAVDGSRNGNSQVKKLLREMDEAEAHRKAHPEEYTPVRDVWAEVIGKHAAKSRVQ